MIYLNGHFLTETEAKIDPADRGFLLADGLFETMKAYKGKIFYLEEHWQRFKKSAQFLDIDIPVSRDELEKIIDDLLLKNNLLQENASVRLTLTRGNSPRGLLPPPNLKPTILLAAFPCSACIAKPISTYIVSIRRNEFSPLANIKSLNYLDNVLARKEAANHFADEAILLNSKGNIVEASAANIFVVTNADKIITPALSEGALPGITRQIVINLAKKLNIPLFETSITLEDIEKSREIFLTNSLIGIQVAHMLNKQAMDIQNTTVKKLKIEYNEIIKKFNS